MTHPIFFYIVVMAAAVLLGIKRWRNRPISAPLLLFPVVGAQALLCSTDSAPTKSLVLLLYQIYAVIYALA